MVRARNVETDMFKYVVSAVTIVLCVLISIVTSNENIVNKSRLLSKKHSDEVFVSKSFSKRNRTIIICLISCASITATLFLLKNCGELNNQIKLSTALVCLSGVAVNDYREQRIPNFFPLVMALLGIICLAFGFVIPQDGAMMYVISSVISTIAVAVCMLVASILTKGGIGMGDIKVLSALALLGGVHTICGTLFFGMLICAGATVVLLITKKKNLQGTVPFGPFIYIGFVVSIIASIY